MKYISNWESVGEKSDLYNLNKKLWNLNICTSSIVHAPCFITVRKFFQSSLFFVCFSVIGIFTTHRFNYGEKYYILYKISLQFIQRSTDFSWCAAILVERFYNNIQNESKQPVVQSWYIAPRMSSTATAALKTQMRFVIYDFN